MSQRVRFISAGSLRSPRFISAGSLRSPRFISAGSLRSPRFISAGSLRSPRFISAGSLLTVLLTSACATPKPQPIVEALPQPTESLSDLTIHTGEVWYRVRGQWLGLSSDEAKKRDETFDAKHAPETTFWDPQLSVEVASLWSALCNECHGGRRRISESRFIPPPQDGWGGGEGYFFGAKKLRERQFQVVFEGGKKVIAEKSKMPSWGGRLSREQIWGLIHYVEFYSMAVEGHFPPGLYPEASDRLIEPGK